MLCMPISKPGSFCLSFPPDHARLEKLAVTWSYRSSLILPCHLCGPKTFPRHRRGLHSRSRTRAFACSSSGVTLSPLSVRRRPTRRSSTSQSKPLVPHVCPTRRMSLIFTTSIKICRSNESYYCKDVAGLRHNIIVQMRPLWRIIGPGLNPTSNTCGPDRHTLAHF